VPKGASVKIGRALALSAAHQRPGCANRLPSKKREGAGNAGRWPQPMARLQKDKQAAVTTGPAETSGIPCAMFYGLYVLSPGTGFLAPVCDNA
jgi:hypothetical protein